MLDINKLEFDETNYYKTKNGKYIELRVDEDPYIDTDNTTIGCGNFISYETYHKGKTDALMEMFYELSDSTRSKLYQNALEYYKEHRNDFTIDEVKEEDYNEWSYVMYDKEGNYVEGIECNVRTDIEEVFLNFFDVFHDSLLSDIENYFDITNSDDILQYTFQNDPTTQAYRTLIYCENTENLPFEEFEAKCNKTFDEAYAVENFGIYSGTFYDKDGDEIDTFYGLPEDVLSDICEYLKDEVVEEINQLPDFDDPSFGKQESSLADQIKDAGSEKVVPETIDTKSKDLEI